MWRPSLPSFARLAVGALAILFFVGCVPKKKYDLSIADNLELREQLDDLKREMGEMSDDLVRLQVELDAAETVIGESSRQLAEKIALTGELAADVERMREALSEQEVRRARAEGVLTGYRKVIEELEELIARDVLSVEFVDGQMVLRLDTDNLFAPGKAVLTSEGSKAVSRVAKVLVALDRDIVIAGHTDSDPILSNVLYPTNWHLGAARAISVVDLLVFAGLPARRIGALSFAEFRPVDSNATPQGKRRNRRIEIVLVPDLATLPEYDALKSMIERRVDGAPAAPAP